MITINKNERCMDCGNIIKNSENEYECAAGCFDYIQTKERMMRPDAYECEWFEKVEE